MSRVAANSYRSCPSICMHAMPGGTCKPLGIQYACQAVDSHPQLRKAHPAVLLLHALFCCVDVGELIVSLTTVLVDCNAHASCNWRKPSWSLSMRKEACSPRFCLDKKLYSVRELARALMPAASRGLHASSVLMNPQIDWSVDSSAEPSAWIQGAIAHAAT